MRQLNQSNKFTMEFSRDELRRIMEALNDGGSYRRGFVDELRNEGNNGLAIQHETAADGYDLLYTDLAKVVG